MVTRQDAFELYDKIDRCIDKLVSSRINDDSNKEVKCLNEMESIMVETLQFLSCLTEPCPYLVDCGDGTYTCIWSIHGQSCELCYKLYPRKYV